MRCSLLETSPSQLFAELSTPPFLAEKRLTFVNAKGDIPKEFAEYLNEAFWKKLIMAIPDDHIVAFISAPDLPALESSLLSVAIAKVYSAETPEDMLAYIKRQLPDLGYGEARLLADRI